MNKNMLYLFLSVITLICLFGTAALCNQCTASGVEKKVDITEEEDQITAEGEEDENKDTVPELEDEGIEEELSEEEKETGEETPEQEEQKESPTITLEIYEGPIYSSADGVCYYRIEAIVTGSPTPSVVFSKDDSGGAWGPKKAQVNLSNTTETYTLTATATNSEDTASDSIELSWGCPLPDNLPEETSPETTFVQV